VSAGDVDGIRRLVSMQSEVLAYLDKLASTDSTMAVSVCRPRVVLFDERLTIPCIHLDSLQGTSEYSACIWGQELTTELARIDVISQIAVEGKDKPTRQALAAELRRGIQGLWEDRTSGDVFGGA
jgi:hypothetical protein